MFGSHAVTKDDKGRAACIELTIARCLVENARRIGGIAIFHRWKTTEVELDGDGEYSGGLALDDEKHLRNLCAHSSVKDFKVVSGF